MEHAEDLPHEASVDPLRFLRRKINHFFFRCQSIHLEKGLHAELDPWWNLPTELRYAISLEDFRFVLQYSLKKSHITEAISREEPINFKKE